MTGKKNMSGQTVGVPIDAYNHIIDPARYITYTELNIQPTIEVMIV